MLYSIAHRTKLNYSDNISESVMELRTMPHTDERQALRQFNLKINPTAKICDHLDWLGNAVRHFSVLGIHDRVVIDSYSVVEKRRSLAPHEMGVPLDSLARDHRTLDFLRYQGPVLDDPRLAELAQSIGLDQVQYPEPTHRRYVDEAYISVAAGRNYADVPPTRGVYRGNAEETMEAGVIIKPLEGRTRPAPCGYRSADFVGPSD